MRTIVSGLALMLALSATSSGAVALGLKFVETADGKQSPGTRELVQWTHSRMVFKHPLDRIAVGQEDTLQLEVLDSRQVLALAQNVGRTSVTAWYEDGTSESFLFSVVEDLSVLHNALRDIHPGIRLTLAPDRAALVLRGKVPTLEFRIAAEKAARHYLGAGRSHEENSGGLLLQTSKLLQANSGNKFRIASTDDQPQAGGRNSAKAAVINLIKIEQLPLPLERKISNAIDGLGGSAVTVSRIQGGDIANDLQDTIILGGYVETQVELVRVLNLAATLITGDIADSGNSAGILALANESGGLVSAGTSISRSASSSFLSGGSGASKPSTGNTVGANIARAKLLSVAGGRILSTIQVRDLPQVRVAVQMYEVNRRSLSQWRPEFTAITAGYDSAGGAFGLSGASRQAASSSQVENALQVLGGALVNNLQIASGDVAFDLLFSMLEQEGISRTLSRPNITVLAGEAAVFRAGGEVPVPTAFAPTGLNSGDQVGPNTGGVFSGTDFKAFGVELQVQAMVDEKDRITLYLNPTISMPDTLLTQEIASSTGTALNSSAFNVRSLSTSARLRDGQPLIIGGLVSRDLSFNRDFTPGVSDVPVLGRLAQADSEADSERELIIIVTPTIIREPRHDVYTWQYPGTAELLAAPQI